MRLRIAPLSRVAGRCACASLSLALCVLLAPSYAVQAQKDDKGKEQQPQLSEGERKAIEKINTSSGIDAKIKAAGEYMKKYSKSPMRPKVSSYIASEIILLQDYNQKATFSQNYLTLFDQPEESDLISPALIESYLNLGKFDDALTLSSKYLVRKPDDVYIHTQLAWAGAAQSQRQAASPGLTKTAMQSAAKAVELMEADKKPADTEQSNWEGYRNSWLPKLYQAQGMMLFYANDKPAAKERLEKAAGLDPYEPANLILLTEITNHEYQTIALKYQAEKKSELLNQAVAKMDEVIEWMARAVAATADNAQMQAVNQQLMENLKSYYSFRHEGKTDGLDQLIQKYKKTQ